MALNNFNLSQVQDYVIRQFGDDANVQLTLPDITKWTNQAMVEIVQQNDVLRASMSTSTVVGQEAYDMPGISVALTPALPPPTPPPPSRGGGGHLGGGDTINLSPGEISYSNEPGTGAALKITNVRIGSHVLHRLGFDQYMMKFQDGASPSPNTYWSMYADQILIGGVPDTIDTLTVFYIPSPKVVANPGDMLPLPDQYFNRICEYVLAKAYAMDEDWQAHQVQRQLFDSGLKGQTYGEEDSAGPFPVVIDVYSSMDVEYLNAW